MANEHDVEAIFRLLMVNYQYFGRETAPEGLADMVDIWKQLLGDIPTDVLRAAALQHIASNRYFPQVSELRDLAINIMHPSTTSPVEAWGEVVKQIHHTGYYGIPQFTDENTAEVVRQLGWQNICMSEMPAADRARFIEAYTAISGRQRTQMSMLPEVRQLAQQLGSGRMLKAGGENANS